MQTATTIRFDDATLERLDGIARALGRPRSWVVKQAVSRYLEYEQWFRDEVDVGLKSIEQGDVVGHDEAKARIRQLGVDVD